MNLTLQLDWQGAIGPSRTGIGRAAFLRDVRQARRARPAKIGAVEQLLQFVLQLRDLLERKVQRDEVACVSRGLGARRSAAGAPRRW